MSEYYVHSDDLSPSPIKLVDSEINGVPTSNMSRYGQLSNQPQFQTQPQFQSQLQLQPQCPLSNGQILQHNSFLQRILKYIIAGIIIAFATYYFIGKDFSNSKQLVSVIIIIAIIFAVMDIISPSIINVNCR